MGKPNFTFDMSMVKSRIRQFLRQHPALVGKTMEEIAMFLEGETKDRTPVDEGTLTADVIGETQTDGGNVAAVIKIPVNAPSSSYAVAMHEGEYQPGSKSLAKQGKTGKQVGSKYITRPIDDNPEEIKDIIKENMRVENYGR